MRQSVVYLKKKWSTVANRHGHRAEMVVYNMAVPDHFFLAYIFLPCIWFNQVLECIKVS